MQSDALSFSAKAFAPGLCDPRPGIQLSDRLAHPQETLAFLSGDAETLPPQAERGKHKGWKRAPQWGAPNFLSRRAVRRNNSDQSFLPDSDMNFSPLLAEISRAQAINPSKQLLPMDRFFLARAHCLSAGLRHWRLTCLPRHDRCPAPGGNRSAAAVYARS